MSAIQKDLKNSSSEAVVEAKAGRAECSPGLQSEFQGSQSSLEKPCLGKKKTKPSHGYHQISNSLRLKTPMDTKLKVSTLGLRNNYTISSIS